MKQLTLGMVAHVDAGKTTLSESLLYTTGTIKHQGRVDHKDTFLDYNTQEEKEESLSFLRFLLLIIRITISHLLIHQGMLILVEKWNVH